MKKRILTGLVLAPLALLVIAWSPPWVFILVLLLVVERSLYEYFRLVREAGFQPVPVIGYVAVAVLSLAQGAFVYSSEIFAANLLVTAVVLSFAMPLLLGLWWPSDPRQYLTATSSTIFGIFYIGFALSLLPLLRFGERPDGLDLTVLMFLVVWADDIFAFVVGRWIGRTPIMPRISPKKTLEGSLGGLAGSFLVGAACTRLDWQTTSWKEVILISGVVAVAGQVGDLVESALKRAGDVKDAGTLLPGHGGLLDRIDSLIFAVPAVALLIFLESALR